MGRRTYRLGKRFPTLLADRCRRTPLHHGYRRESPRRRVRGALMNTPWGKSDSEMGATYPTKKVLKDSIGKSLRLDGRWKVKAHYQIPLPVFRCPNCGTMSNALVHCTKRN